VLSVCLSRYVFHPSHVRTHCLCNTPLTTASRQQRDRYGRWQEAEARSRCFSRRFFSHTLLHIRSLVCFQRNCPILAALKNIKAFPPFPLFRIHTEQITCSPQPSEIQRQRLYYHWYAMHLELLEVGYKTRMEAYLPQDPCSVLFTLWVSTSLMWARDNSLTSQ
jgi:hypothetical protein